MEWDKREMIWRKKQQDLLADGTDRIKKKESKITLRQGSQRQKPSRKCKCEKQLDAALAPSKVDAATLGWSPELPVPTFFSFGLFQQPQWQVSGPPVSPPSNPPSTMCSDAKSGLLKWKPNYATSLLKILKWFPIEAVFFKVLFLAAKPFLQTKV